VTEMCTIVTGVWKEDKEAGKAHLLF
jgi:hypothetical protein